MTVSAIVIFFISTSSQAGVAFKRPPKRAAPSAALNTSFFGERQRGRHAEAPAVEIELADETQGHLRSLARRSPVRIDRVSLAWNHAIEKDSFKIKRVGASPYRKIASRFSKDML
jgi:hypothetical protein